MNAAADFDKVYLAQQEPAHSKALTLMQGFADHGDDAGPKAAAKAVPKVQAHLDKVRALKGRRPRADLRHPRRCERPAGLRGAFCFAPGTTGRKTDR